MTFSILFSTIAKLALQACTFGGVALGIGIPMLLVQILVMLNLLRIASTLVHLQASNDAVAQLRSIGSPLTAARLKVRLRYVVQKYSERAPRWQFFL